MAAWDCCSSAWGLIHAVLWPIGILVTFCALCSGHFNRSQVVYCDIDFFVFCNMSLKFLKFKSPKCCWKFFKSAKEKWKIRQNCTNCRNTDKNISKNNALLFPKLSLYGHEAQLPWVVVCSTLTISACVWLTRKGF